MKGFLVFIVAVFGFSAWSTGQAIVGASEKVTVWVEEDEGRRSYEIPHHDLSPKFAKSNYYCKKHEGNKWIRCSRRTGQCFGEPFSQKFQCERALP